MNDEELFDRAVQSLKDLINGLRVKADDASSEQQEAILENLKTLHVLLSYVVNGKWFEAGTIVLQLDNTTQRMIPLPVRKLLEKEN